MKRSNILPELSTRTRTGKAFLIGAASGIIWLLPVLGEPSSAAVDDVSILRVARLTAPLLVFALVDRSAYQTLLKAIFVKVPSGIFPRWLIQLLVVAFALGVVPLAAGLVSANIPFIISAVFPLTISLLVLVGITLLEGEVFARWVMGIGFAAVLFLGMGFATSGFGFTTYYGRSRALMGFKHPINTASDLLGVLAYVVLFYGPHVRAMDLKKRNRTIAWATVLSLILLEISQSRNVLISLLIGLGSTALALRSGRMARFGIFCALLAVPMTLYGIVIFGSPDNPAWEALNQLTSQRLGVYQIVLQNLVTQGGGLTLIANNAQSSSVDSYVGFAATDSVYLSFLTNYGALGLIGFVVMLLVLASRLTRSRRTAYPFGALCALVIFFSLDAQGITASNLIVFAAFAYAVRCGIRGAPN